jgi:REP element-mobilizing transposase RayT
MSGDFRYDRQSIRMPGYDYSVNGYYFVTICIQNHECLMGSIENGKMEMNEKGNVIDKEWKMIPKRFVNVCLDVYQIMPNHMHGIIKINHSVGAGLSRPNNHKNVSNDVNVNRHMGMFIGREDRAPTSMQPTLGQIIGYFKYQTTKIINRADYRNRFWQRNYWDRIIRNEPEYFKIANYIRTNPENWEQDKLFTPR